MKKEHRILDEVVEDVLGLLKTTYEGVLYDPETDEFVLFTSQGCCITVSGKHRFKVARDIADYLNKAKEDD